jgi:hypothetical protein
MTHCTPLEASRGAWDAHRLITLLLAVKPGTVTLVFFSWYNHGHWQDPFEDRHTGSVCESLVSCLPVHREHRWWYWDDNTTLPVSDVDLWLFGRVIFH